jgi:hypothetical protein
MGYVGGKPVVVNHLTGDSRKTVPLVVAMLKGVLPGHTGLGGINYGNICADTANFSRSDVMARIRDHGSAEFRHSNLNGIIVVENNDQATELRELGDKFRQDHKLCRTPSIGSDFCVALGRGGLSPGTFSNVNSYGANVVSKLLPQAGVEGATLALRLP